MTDEELEDTMWEEARPWEEKWETLKVNESKRKRKKSMALGKMFGSIFPVTSGREEG